MPSVYRKAIAIIGIFWWMVTNIFDLIMATFVPRIHERRTRASIEIMIGTRFAPKDYVNSEYSWKFVLHAAKSRLLDVFKEAQLNQVAPNPTVVCLDGSRKKLLDFIDQDRPLVVNFGSCT